MRYAKRAITLAIGLVIIGGSIGAAAASPWQYSNSYFHRSRDNDRYGDNDRRSENSRGEHRDGRGEHHEDRGDRAGRWR
jgi:hypothetical protein